jgi:hypothetical protein
VGVPPIVNSCPTVLRHMFGHMMAVQASEASTICTAVDSNEVSDNKSVWLET